MNRASPRTVRDAVTAARAAVVAAAFTAACSGLTAQTNSFATLAEARAAGAIANGYLPEGLPPGTHDIREGHVPGTSQKWGLFEYPQSEESLVRALLQPDEVSLVHERCDVPPRVEWWPPMLRGPLDRARLEPTGIHTYRSRTGNLLVAVNWSQGRAYYCAQ